MFYRIANVHIQLMDLNLEKILVVTNEAATLATYTHARIILYTDKAGGNNFTSVGQAKRN